MDDVRRSPAWVFVDGSISVSASMLLAVLVSACDSCDGVWLLGFLKGLTGESAGLVVVATLLLFPTAVVVYGGLKMWFAAKEAVERKAKEKGREEERGRIERSMKARGMSDREIAQILAGEPALPLTRPYRRRSGRNGR